MQIFFPVASLTFAIGVIATIIGANDLVGKFLLIVETFQNLPL